MTAHRVLSDLLQAPFIEPDPGDAGDLTVKRDRQIYLLSSAAAETRTLKDPPAPGLQMTLVMETDGGDITVTADTEINQAGNTQAVAADAGDHLKLESIENAGSLMWRVVANDGWALS